jgi:PAS domain S-box-containing protein
LNRKSLPLYKRIVFWIVMPVTIVALAISGLLIAYLSPPIDAFLTHQFDANLRLAGNLGLRICESSFNYLLDLRLENNAEMNQALKNEALEEIKAISSQVPAIHLLVFDADRKIGVWSLDSPIDQWLIPVKNFKNNTMTAFDINGQQVKAHTRYFPFWDWYIVSFVFEKDFRSPIYASQKIIYLSTFGVFLAVLATLLIVFNQFVNKPLKRLVTATEGISEGRLFKVDNITDNELGRLMTAFNAMVASLENEKAEVRHLIGQLKISASQFKTLFESAPAGICVAENAGKIVRTNISLQQITGYSKTELQAMNFCDLFSDPRHCMNLLLGATADHPIDNYETLFKPKNGTDFPVRMILTRIMLDQQEALFAIIENISVQKKLERQLFQSRKLEAVGSLAGGVAHDFNNLLSPILGFGELLLEDLDSDDGRRQSVEAIVKAAYRARDIVRQLLAFSRKQTLEFQTIDLNKIISDFYGLLRRTIREDICIENILDPSIPFINADPGQLEQIIMNLAVNAQDAMPKGGRLTIETSPIELDAGYAARHEAVRPGHYIMLAVSDSGHGMDAKTLEQIFDPFFTTKDKGQGTGFGLATVYGIVKQHNGNIWAYSEPQQGSTFKIYFPVAQQNISVHETDTGPPLQNRQGTETILVVEDDASVLEMTRSILNRQGYRVLSASKAAEAIQLATTYQDTIHLLLTDVIMPEMNGRELCAQISDRFPEMKVIYMSGYTHNVIAHHGILDQGINFIQKPFPLKSLIAKVRQVLDAREP